MLNICVNCGVYRPDKVIDLTGPHAICPECGPKHPFLQLPLLIVTGASGAGKSTVCHQLLGKLLDVVLLDSDILWRSEFAIPGTVGPNFFETWLRVAKSIGQSGRPVVLFGAGMWRSTHMATIFDLASNVDWADLAEGEVRIIPLLQYENGVRVRMLVTRRGEWPKHVEEKAELYVVLKGEVVHITESDHPVRAGEAILLAPGEPHGARVEDGAVSINVDFA
jgi:quercetin dioxygenase-like cupin family protein